MTSLLRGHVLAQDERAGLELSPSGRRSLAMNTNARRRGAGPALQPGRDRRARCRPARRRTRPGSGRSRPASVSAAPRSSRTMSCDERQLERARGCPSAQPRIAPLTTGRRAVRATTRTIAGEDAARRAGTGRSRRAVPPPIGRGRAAAAAAARSARVLRQVARSRRPRGRRAGPGAAAIPRASAGADRHRLALRGSWGRGMDERSPRPCVELVLEDDRRGLAIDPRPIGVALGLATAARPSGRASSGPRRVSARWLVRRSSRKATGKRRCAPRSASAQARVSAAWRP